MTDPQTPATKAGRHLVYGVVNPDDFVDAILAIEAEARADVEGELALCRRAEDALQQTASILLAKVETARADVALAAEPPALDVERLARAMVNVGAYYRHETADGDHTFVPRTTDEFAALIGPEYARLAREEGT